MVPDVFQRDTATLVEELTDAVPMMADPDVLRVTMQVGSAENTGLRVSVQTVLDADALAINPVLEF